MKPYGIETQTMALALVNYPKAEELFLEVLDKSRTVKHMYFDYAYGVTPALFVVFVTDEDEFLERIRLEK